MRADALQRKRRILLEARRLFAERDSSISLDIIAEASSVGIATLLQKGGWVLRALTELLSEPIRRAGT